MYVVLRRCSSSKTESLYPFAKVKYDLSAYDVLQSLRLNTAIFCICGRKIKKSNCFFKVIQVIYRVDTVFDFRGLFFTFARIEIFLLDEVSSC